MLLHQQSSSTRGSSVLWKLNPGWKATKKTSCVFWAISCWWGKLAWPRERETDTEPANVCILKPKVELRRTEMLQSHITHRNRIINVSIWVPKDKLPNLEELVQVATLKDFNINQENIQHAQNGKPCPITSPSINLPNVCLLFLQHKFNNVSIWIYIETRLEVTQKKVWGPNPSRHLGDCNVMQVGLCLSTVQVKNVPKMPNRFLLWLGNLSLFVFNYNFSFKW